MLATIILVLSGHMVSALDNSTYSITPITSPLLREEMFPVRFYHEVWTTIHFVDMTEVKRDSEQMSAYIEELDEVCLDHSECSETVTIKLLRQRLEKINTDINSLLPIGYANARRRRGLINFVGTISKFLFGTMSADDAAEINKQIDAVYSNSAGIAHLVKNQTSIIKNTIRQLSKVAQEQDEDIKMLRQILKGSGAQAVKNQLNLKLIDGCAQAAVHLENLKEVVNLLLDAVNSGKTGVVSPALVTPENFLAGLNKIKDNLYFKELPFPLSSEYYITYMKISKVNMITQSRLVYTINTPIPTGQQYTAFKFTPIPISGWTQYYIYDNINTNPIAINSANTEYTQIDPSSCVDISSTRLCELTSPVHRLIGEEGCYAHLIKDKTDEGCTRKYFSLLDNYVYALKNGYSWYILPIKPEIVTISCYSASDSTIEIKSAAILEIHPQCRGSSALSTYLPRSHTNNTISKEYRINITISKVELSLLNNTELKIPKLQGRHVDIQAIQDIADTLDDLTENLEILTENHRKRTWISTGYSVLEYLGYGSIMVVTILIMYRCHVFAWILELIKRGCRWLCAPCINVFVNCVSPVAQPNSPTYNNSAYNPAIQYHPHPTAPSLRAVPPEERPLY